MKCLILAAGYATRLYPLTENFPKPLLKVGDKAILDWLIDDLEQTGLIEEYVVVTNHKFAHIFEEWAEGRPSISVIDDGTSTNQSKIVLSPTLSNGFGKFSVKGYKRVAYPAAKIKHFIIAIHLPTDISSPYTSLRVLGMP